MAETATIYHFSIDLADMDRDVYETLELRVARHPSETIEYMTVRVLAYCLEYTEGIALTGGVSSGDEPAILVRDLTGIVTGWIEVGLPDASRLHRAAKSARRVAVYPHRDPRQWWLQLDGQRIHRASDIIVRTFDRDALATLIARLERRNSLSLSVSQREVLVSFADTTLTIPVSERRIESPSYP